MQQLLLFFLVAFPLMLLAQTNEQTSATHQQAEANFMARNPNAQKVDLEKLTAEQKDDLAKCNTCGLKSLDSKETASSSIPPAQRLETLQAEQARIIAIMKPLIENHNDDGMLKKYQISLIRNVQQTKIVEAEVAQAEKDKKNKELRELKKSK